jgi:hypothetical protein
MKQKQYLVTWEIDITADSPREAAIEAMILQQDKNSEAVAFTVKEQATGELVDVDLLEELQKEVDLLNPI